MPSEYRDVVGRMLQVDILRRICLQKAASESGLYFGQLPILQFISEHPGCTQKEIADRTGVTSASIALSTKRMQKAGLLTKTIDAQDLRCNRLELTETGVEYMRKCVRKFEEVDRISFRGFSNEELETLTGLLDKILENMAGDSRLPDRFELFRIANRLDAQKNRCLEPEENDCTEDRV